MSGAKLKRQTGQILVIEPNRQAAKEIATLLNKRGYRVQTFDCFVDAVEQLAHRLFDCAIVNVDVPGMRRCDSVRMLKVVSPELPIIATAENNSRELETEVRQSDIFYYHLKDFSLQELVFAIQGACLKQTKEKEKTKQLGGR